MNNKKDMSTVVYLVDTSYGLMSRLESGSYTDSGEPTRISNDTHVLNAYIVSAVLVLVCDAKTICKDTLPNVNRIYCEISNIAETTFYLEAAESMKKWQLEKMYEEAYKTFQNIVDSLAELRKTISECH